MAENLSGRGMKGGVYRSGSYKKARDKGYKVAGLSRKEMGRATTLKGQSLTKKQRARASELKDISTTKFVKGKGVVGPGGKAFTGSVQLASGKTASYVKGRRIGVGPKKKPASRGNGGVTPPPAPTPKATIPTSRVSPSARGEGSSGRTPSARQISGKYRGQNRPRTSTAQFIAPAPKTVYVPAINRSVPKGGYTAATNPYNKGRVASVNNMTRGNIAKATLAAAALYPAAAGVSGVARIAATGRAAGAGARTGISSLGRTGTPTSAAGRGGVSSATRPVSTVKDIGGKTSGVSKKTGGPLKDGKPVAPTAKKPTAAQAAAAKRSAAAKKAAATRKANASKKTSATKSTTRRRRSR